MNKRTKRSILKAYYKDNTLVQSQIDSYNYFIEEGIKEIIMNFSRKDVPEYLIDVYDTINLRIKDVWLKEPQHIETDGSVIELTPHIARLRGLTYAAPLFLNIETKIDGKKEEFEVQIAKMPIMLKSKKCILYKKTKEELIELGEDPYELGGYFVVNGTEKVVVMMEDLALNKFFFENSKDDYPSGRMFSERGVYKSLQEIKKQKDGTYTYSFGNFKNLPIFLLIKALGLESDKEIVELTGITDSEILYQMSEFSSLKKADIFEILAKKFNLFGSQKDKDQRIDFYLNNFVVPHIGIEEKDRIGKAQLIAKLFKRYYKNLNSEEIVYDDKDHYSNKRVKLVGLLFDQLFVGSFNDLIIDILINFQRIIKRNKFHSMKIIIRKQLLTQKIHSALSIGVWSDGRKGVAQYLKRENFFDMISHMTRVISPLSSSQENFLAREAHPTHYGRLCPIETPEGTNIGLRKNMAMMTEVSYENHDESENTREELSMIGLVKPEEGNEKTDVILNDKFIGTCKQADRFVSSFKKKRRTNYISRRYNIRYDKQNETVFIEGKAGRLRRALIVVENGKSKLTQQIIDDLEKNKINFNDLLSKGIIEFIDAGEEENCYVAYDEKDLTVEHTHLEILEAMFLGLNTGTVPFGNFDDAGRLIRGQKTIKQAIGAYALNFMMRKETDRNSLVNMQKPLTSTFFYDLMEWDKHPAGQNMTVAIMSFEGYNMEDGLILNKSSIEFGMQRSFYYKIHTSAEVKYPGGLQDRICKPTSEVKNYRLEEDYRFLDEDGIAKVGSYVRYRDVIIGKISPPRFNEDAQGFGQMINVDIDASQSLKEDEKGRISKVFVLENNLGDKEISIILRDQRAPIVGDKFASRHGQKGVVGAVFRQADMPFTENGIVPDMITSPHSIPGRKTVSHIKEILAGKVASLRGKTVDASPFDGEEEFELRNELEKMGFNRNGTEVMYDPKTGKKMNVEIYVGSIYYLRLKHQVENKIQARGIGPVQLLTRQPAEGRIRGGGLKLGEMEKDALISHGATLLLKERFSADQTTALICQSCGYLADPYLFNYKSKCPVCNGSKFDKIELAYAFKLLVNEIRSMGINCNFKTKDRFFDEEEIKKTEDFEIDENEIEELIKDTEKGEEMRDKIEEKETEELEEEMLTDEEEEE